MPEPIDLREKVVAVFDTIDATDAAVSALRAEGYDVEVLRGEEGRRRLNPDEGDQGFLESLKNALETALGDEDRILDNVDAELAQDGSFVVVESSNADEAEIASILKDHGGHYRWHFDKWTYVSLGRDREE
jgi:hypothetical protein